MSTVISNLFWFALYMSPTIVAAWRKSPHVWRIGWTNFLLGWTIVMWFVDWALVFDEYTSPYFGRFIQSLVNARSLTGGGGMAQPQNMAGDPGGAQMRPCSMCGTSGRVTCSTCGGRGHTFAMPTGEYGTQQTIPCGACMSSGKVTCMTCGGTGKVW